MGGIKCYTLPLEFMHHSNNVLSLNISYNGLTEPPCGKESELDIVLT